MHNYTQSQTPRQREALDAHQSNHPRKQHTHEFLGSVQIAGPQANLLHNHRFACITGEAIPLSDGNHAHSFDVNTDFTKGHSHTISGRTSPAIQVGDGKHVHYAKGQSSSDINHTHKFRFAVLIDDPIDF